MKILIQNYLSPLSTEPLYLNEAFTRSQGCVTSTLWDSNTISVYDAIDKITPDVVLFHARNQKLWDLFKRLSGTSIELVINVTSLNDNELMSLNAMVNTHKIKCPFWIDNSIGVAAPFDGYGIETIKLLPAADTFLGVEGDFDFHIGAAVISSNPQGVQMNDLIQKHPTYHNIMLVRNQQDVGNPNYDLHLNIMTLAPFYSKYNEIILVDEPRVLFSQIFFDATLNSPKVSLACSDVKALEANLKILFEEEQDGDIGQIVKDTILAKHTCKQRAIQFANALKASNLAKVLETI